MNRDRKAMFWQLQNFLFDCESNGVSDFRVWCEDNLETPEQEKLLESIADHVQAVADILF